MTSVGAGTRTTVGEEGGTSNAPLVLEESCTQKLYNLFSRCHVTQMEIFLWLFCLSEFILIPSLPQKDTLVTMKSMKTLTPFRPPMNNLELVITVVQTLLSRIPTTSGIWISLALPHNSLQTGVHTTALNTQCLHN